MTSPSGWSPEPEPPRPESIMDLLRRVVGDARAYLNAEASRQKLRAAFIASCVRDIAIAAVLALILLAGFLVTLMIGLVWALASLLGHWGALAAVLGGTLLLILVLGLFAMSRVKRMTGRLKR